MITEIAKIQPVDGSDIQQLAAEGENIELRESLGLPPLKLKEENAKFFNFRFLTEDESKVYGVLFPVKTPIDQYNDFIPTDVLAALKEVQDTCPYRLVESPMVWHAKEYDPDPILTVGIRTKDDEHTFVDRHVLIARWGEALKDFTELSAIAFKKWKTERVDRLNHLRDQIELELKKTENAQSIGSVTRASVYL